MKSCILIIAALASFTLHAQETKLSLEVIPGKLASQLTEEQMSTVTELTLTGEMYNCDFRIIQDMIVLEKLDLSNALVDSIPASGFIFMDNLKHIEMSPILDFLGIAAFPKNLYSITWANYPKEIKEDAFIKSQNLQQYYVSENNPDYLSIDGILFSKDQKKLIAFPPCNYKESQSYTVPNGIEEIGHDAFIEAYLTIVELPKSIKYIGDRAFHVHAKYKESYRLASALSQLICYNTKPPILGTSPFHCQHNTVLTVPMNSKDLYSATIGWNFFSRVEGLKSKLSIKVIPGKLATQLTEEQMSAVTELTLTGEMYNCDFYTIRDKMKNLEILDIKNILADTIPKDGLSHTNLEKIILPKALNSIEDKAFAYSSLSEVIWLNFPENIGDYIFHECNINEFSVESETLNCVSIDGVLFSEDKEKLLLYPPYKSNYYIIPEGTKIIGAKAFKDTGLYNHVCLPRSLEMIEDKSFEVEIGTTSNGVSVAIYGVECLSLTPPICKGDPFGYKREDYPFPDLKVPYESTEAYLKNSYWGEFFKHPGPNELSDLSINTYANVKDGILQIEVNEIKNAILYLFNMDGKEIGNYSINSSSISIDNLQKGIYFYRLETNGKLLDEGKFIIN